MDFEKHRSLWNDAIYGSPETSLVALRKLNERGEIGETTYQACVFASLMAATEKGGKQK